MIDHDTELEQAIQDAASGVRDPVLVREACERLDRMREEMRHTTSVLDVAVDLIREGRDEHEVRP